MTNRTRALRVALATLLLAVGMPSGAAGSALYAEGIDVSHWQGTISWPTVAASGKTFAFLKATQGTGYLDATYATNRSGANANGIPVGAINNIAQVCEHPQVKARGSLVDIDHPKIGKTKIVGPVAKLSETPASIRSMSPSLGQHTEEVLREVLGMNEQDIAQLRTEGVIADKSQKQAK